MKFSSPVGPVVGSILLLSMLTASPSWANSPGASSADRPHSGPAAGNVPGRTANPISLGVPQPIAGEPYLDIELIDHIEWRQSPFGRTVKVYPTAWLRLNGGTYDIGEAAWNELYEKYRTSITKNLNGLRDQMICHVELGPMKDTYNLDEWLASVGYDATVAAGCQPGKDS